MGKFCQIFTEVSDSDTTIAGYYSLKFFYLRVWISENVFFVSAYFSVLMLSHYTKK